MAEVVCLGELLVDMMAGAEAPGEEPVDDVSAGDVSAGEISLGEVSLGEATYFHKAPGGAPANVAVGLARLGRTSAFVGQVGDDPFGHWLRDTLARENVDVSHLLHSQVARTTMAFIAARRDGQKDICFYRNPGADALLSSADLRPQLLEDVRIFHCGSVSLSQSPCREAQMRVAQMCVERGVLVSFDPNWRPSLWDDADEARELIWQMIPLSDVVKIAAEEWEFITGTNGLEDGATKIRAAGPRLVIVTRGAQGAYFNCAAASGEVPGVAADALDSLGAGDAFVAGMLAKILERDALADLLNEADLRRVVQFANACGAFATQSRGALPGLPTREEIERFQTNE